MRKFIYIINCQKNPIEQDFDKNVQIMEARNNNSVKFH